MWLLMIKLGPISDAGNINGWRSIEVEPTILSYLIGVGHVISFHFDGLYYDSCRYAYDILIVRLLRVNHAIPFVILG